MAQRRRIDAHFYTLSGQTTDMPDDDYYPPVLVPERHQAAVEAFLADLEEMERYAAENEQARYLND